MANLAATFEIGQATCVVPGAQVDELLEQLDRPRGGQAGAEANVGGDRDPACA